MATSQVLQRVASDHTKRGLIARKNRQSGANSKKSQGVETTKPAQHTTSWCHCSVLLHAESAGQEAVMGWGAAIECVDAIRSARAQEHNDRDVNYNRGARCQPSIDCPMTEPNKQVGGMHGSKHCEDVHAKDGMSTGFVGC